MGTQQNGSSSSIHTFLSRKRMSAPAKAQSPFGLDLSPDGLVASNAIRMDFNSLSHFFCKILGQVESRMDAMADQFSALNVVTVDALAEALENYSTAETVAALGTHGRRKRKRRSRW